MNNSNFLTEMRRGIKVIIAKKGRKIKPLLPLCSEISEILAYRFPFINSYILMQEILYEVGSCKGLLSQEDYEKAQEMRAKLRKAEANTGHIQYQIWRGEDM